jgi:catechol 2,3-dioxygenase-like lactoylglutathione lyase family enzyme
MLKGLNHITLAVSDLDTSFQFYTLLLGFKPEVKWSTGAYLSLGNLWLCLSLGEAKPALDYTHIALDIAQENFATFSETLINAGVVQWKENSSEGDSLYFLDPDGHKLEVHVGSLLSRLQSLQRKPYAGATFY